MAKRVLIFLWLVALARTEENAKSEDVAYSSIYTSFGSHTNTDTETSDAAIKGPPALDEKIIKSAPIYETVIENSKPNEGAPVYTITQDVTNTDTATNTETNSRDSIIYSIPNVQTALPVAYEATPAKPVIAEAKAIVPATSGPANAKGSSNPVFSPAFIGKERLLTPGLSTFASSADKFEGEHGKITIIEITKATEISETIKAPETTDVPKASVSKITKEAKDVNSETDTETHASFDGFGTNYSW